VSLALEKNFDSPDELRTPAKASVAVVDLDGAKVARLVFEPGWRWSESVKRPKALRYLAAKAGLSDAALADIEHPISRFYRLVP
jgi:hypothetical protein